MKRLFRQIFGNSVFAYYQTARLEEASVLLQQYPVAEAGYRLGFTNISHFARVFARHYGVLPKKYQQQTSPSVE